MATHLGGAESGTRFASVTDDDIETLVANKDSKNTKKATKSAVAVFEQYLKAKKICCRFETVTPPELNDILKRFWVEARKQNGEKYTKTSLTSIRFGLWRFIKNCRPEMDIMSSPDFKQSNTVFKAQTVQLKREGKAKVQHKPTISEEDLQKLYSSSAFDMNTAAGLQNKVWFEVMLFFCRRGQENLHELKRDSFAFSMDATGRRYVYQQKDELTKNHREDCEAQEGGLMYEIPGSPICPLLSMEKYISKLNPRNAAFFQRPKEHTTPEDPIWYCNQVVGINTLGSKMKNLSRDVQLSRVYTNHSIRATSVTILDNSGFQAHHIMTVSGHKTESSIRSYASKTADNVKRAMSDSLSTALHSHDIQLLQPEAPLVSADPLTVPDLDLNDLIPREWLEWFENDSEEPSISALTVQQQQPLHALQNYSVQNKTVNVDTAKHASSQFCFYNCSVSIINNN